VASISANNRYQRNIESPIELILVREEILLVVLIQGVRKRFFNRRHTLAKGRKKSIVIVEMSQVFLAGNL
jgi:hypothetical protein